MKKLMVLRLLAVTALLAPVQAIAQQAQEAPTPPPYYYYGYWPWHMWAMFPIALLFFIIICGAMLLFMRGAFGMAGHFPDRHWHMAERFPGDVTQSALAILNERYARGEIQKEEYLEKKATLLSRG